MVYPAEYGMIENMLGIWWESVCDSRYNDIKELKDISSFTSKEIKTFFENYKKPQGVDMKVESYHSKKEALNLIKKCMIQDNFMKKMVWIKKIDI